MTLIRTMLALACAGSCFFFGSAMIAQGPTTPVVGEVPAKPKLKITPGKVVVPTDAMRRPWGELVSVDLKNRTGVFRNESDDRLMPFTVLPYAELLHHATFGDLHDFRIGERAIFRLHENEAGEWVWLTYIQDEMNMLNGHKEYYHVDEIDAATKKLVCTQGNADKSYVREKGIVIETDAETRYWKAGAPATFDDVRPGMMIRTQTHGRGKGRVRIAWEVFLDDESLKAFQDKQKSMHAARLRELGAPGYIDAVEGRRVSAVMFQEGNEVTTKLRPGQTVMLAPAGIDRLAIQNGLLGKILSAKAKGKLVELTAELEVPTDKLMPGGVFRLQPLTAKAK